MRTLAACLMSLILVPWSLAKDKKSAGNQAPVVWGMLTQNTGCVIFKEYRKTNAKFWGVAVTTKTFSGLEVIESQNYELATRKWIEDQDGMNELQRLAVKDKIKFVKIPEKYTDNQLEMARAACKEPSVTP